MPQHEPHARIPGIAVLSVLFLTTTGAAQEQAGRATLEQNVSRDRVQQQLQQQQTQNLQRPAAGTIDDQLPPELEQLLIAWEQQSSEIEKLRGTFMRYVYDNVFNFEKRAQGMFWYESPDRGRMDFQAVAPPDPPINPDKVGPDGAPYRIETDENQRWICTGKGIYIIHDDLEIFDYIEIPPHQQGRNITNGPLPFLFGMRADDARERYSLSLGQQHWPEGRVVERDGQAVRERPQVHVIAYPKLAQDAREWRQAEVLLDGVTFLPRAIRLLDPTMNKETVYVFDLSRMKLNERFPWLPNPINETPPRDYRKHFDSRAEGDGIDSEIVPAGAGEARP